LVTARNGPGPLPSPLPRFEDERLITGNGYYVANLVADDVLHAWFVRSPYPTGEIVDIHKSDALTMPGVVAVYTATDLSLRDMPAPMLGRNQIRGMDRPMLARDRVTYVGEPVAVVIAETARQAEDAAQMLFVDVEPGDPVLTVADAAGDNILIHPKAGTNVVLHEHLVEGGVSDVEGLVNITVEVEHPRLAPSPIETLTALAKPADGGIHIQVGVQTPHRLRGELAQVMALDPHRIRVSVPDVGGAFGTKRFYPEYAVVAKSALVLNRPVMWVQPRREMFVGGYHGRGQRHKVSLGATADGRIHTARFSLTADTGAYPHQGAQIGLFSRLVATGLYHIPHVEFELLVVVTNLPPVAPYRGAGRPEAALAIERAIDALARELLLDPAEVRKRNFIADLPYKTATGAKHDSGDYRSALDRALAVSGYDAVRSEQAKRRRIDAKPIGVGIGAFIERAGGAADSWEFGAVEIAEDGTVIGRTGSTSAGQGHETALRRVVAEVFGVEPQSVVLHAGDTAEIADSVGTFASRSAQIGASALWRCAERVRVAAAEVAADMLEAPPSDMVLSAGVFHVAGVPDRGIELAEVVTEATSREIRLTSQEKYSPGVHTFPYGVHVAVVEVELETGQVTPLRLVAVDDVGTVLDEMMVAGQVHGSVMQGIGAALYEEMRYDEDGQPQTASFASYLLPSADLGPPLRADHLTHPAPSNPLGAKGAGEGGCIGMPAAIVNAVLDALAPLGVKELQIPLTPFKVWSAIQAVRQ
jgi:carbon-monoxide dehydrogenase large subunit